VRRGWFSRRPSPRRARRDPAVDERRTRRDPIDEEAAMANMQRSSKLAGRPKQIAGG